MLSRTPRPALLSSRPLRRRRRALLGGLAALTCLATAPAALADEPSLDLRGFTVPTDPNSGMYLEPAATPDTGEWNVGLWGNYVFRPITLRDQATDERVFDVIQHQITADVVANVGIAKRVALGVDLPVLLWQTGDSPTAASTAALGSSELPGQAIGDLGLVGKLTIVQPTGGDLGGFSLGLLERFTLPTGDTASYLGEGSITSETRLLAEYRLVALGIHATAGFKVRAQHEDFACGTLPSSETCPTRFGNEIPFGLGLSLRPQAFGIDEKGKWTFFLETHGYLPAGPVAPFTSVKVSEMQLGLSARYAVAGDVSLLAGVETALLGGVGNAPLRGVLSVGWAPRVHDIDHDGVPDDVDQCRELPEDRDGFQDDDGCPEGDNDDDGVPDDDDKCPTAQEDEDGYQDDDGCPDPDNDGDGIQDAQDACADKAGPANANPKLNGCPIIDVDHDGIGSDKDKCPDKAEDKDGYQDDDGCPDPDNDGDGVLDAQDACPGEKGARSADPKKNGCPDRDPDKDTFLGPDDKCPTEPEAFNGYEDDDGCPDTPKGHAAKPLVVVREKKGAPIVELASPVKLSKEGAIDPASNPTIRALAAELAQHPTWTLEVGVRPAPKPKGTPEQAMARAGAVASAIASMSGRANAAKPVDWSVVRAQPGAEAQGIGYVLEGYHPDAAGAAKPADAGKAPAPNGAPAPKGARGANGAGAAHGSAAVRNAPNPPAKPAKPDGKR